MKKLLCILTSVLLGTLSNSTADAQCLVQGSNIFGLGVRLGIYNIQTTLLNPPQGSTNTTGNGRAADVVYPFSYDRALSDRITVGGQFRYNSFILGKDTSATQLNVAWGIDVGPDAAFHFVRTNHTDLYLQAFSGFAYIKLAENNAGYQGVFAAGGITYGLELGARFYIGSHFGILVNISYSGYDYPNGSVTGGGSTENISLFMTGSMYGLGLCYKL